MGRPRQPVRPLVGVGRPLLLILLPAPRGRSSSPSDSGLGGGFQIFRRPPVELSGDASAGGQFNTGDYAMEKGTVIDTLVVHLVGDNSDYKSAMKESKAVLRRPTK